MVPFVTEPAEREALAAIIRDVVTATSAHATESPYDLADLAVLRAYVTDIAPDDDDVGGEALAAAIERFGRYSNEPGLYGGAARIGWTVAHLTDGDVAEQVCASIDAAIDRSLGGRWTQDYDLVRGLVGIGVYAFERGPAGRPMASRVLDHLEATARPRGPGLAWLTSPELLPAHQRVEAPAGYWNLGLAHGIAGVIALLAHYVAHDVEAERAGRLLAGAVAFVTSLDVPAGQHLPAWIAEGSDEPATVNRVAWCYGDLGIAVGLLAAAQATGEAAWRERARALADRCIDLPYPATRVVDTGLCHGSAGVAHLYHRLYRATGEARFAGATRTWLDRTLALRNAASLAGFPARATDGSESWVADATILTGAPGVALVLHELIADGAPAWARLLLSDLAV